MRRLIGRAALAALATGGLGLATTTAAHADPAGDGSFFFDAPSRVADDPYVTSGDPLFVGPGSGGRFINFTTASAFDPASHQPVPLDAGQLRLGPCGTTPTTVISHWEAGENTQSMAYVPAGSCVTTSTTVRIVADAWAHETTTPLRGGQRYFPLPDPVTVLDTVASGGALGSVTSISTAAAGVPASSTGVAVLIAVAGASGTVTTFGCGAASSLASSLSTAGGYAENVAYVPMGAPGRICLDTYTTGHLDGIVQVLGYFTDSETSGGVRPPTLVGTEVSPPGLSPIAPTRVLDTRPAGAKLGAGEVHDLDLSGYVSPDSTAVVMNLTATEADAPGYLTAYPCDEPRPTASNVNYVAGQTVANLTTVQLSADGHVCIFSLASAHVIADLAGVYDIGGGGRYGAVTPSRVLDTRSGAPFAAGEVRRLQVAGGAGVPAGATAVTLNLTATETAAPGYLTAYPCDVARPEASNVNYLAGQTVPNLVTVRLAADGSVCLYSFAPTHVIADVAGYYGADGAAGLYAQPPERILDTRSDWGEPLAAGDLIVLDRYDDGSRHSTAAGVLNITATDADGPGYLTAYPCDEPRPTASNVNYVAGQTVANVAVAKLAADSSVCIYAFATTHVVIDTAGDLDRAPLVDTTFRQDTVGAAAVQGGYTVEHVHR